MDLTVKKVRIDKITTLKESYKGELTITMQVYCNSITSKI